MGVGSAIITAIIIYHLPCQAGFFPSLLEVMLMAKSLLLVVSVGLGRLNQHEVTH